MKKSVFLLVGFVLGITLILHCSGGNAPVGPKDVNADVTADDLQTLQTQIDALTARVEALETDNNHGLSQGIVGTWNVEYIPDPDAYSGTMTFNEDGTYSCSGTSPYIMECDGATRDYTLNNNLITMKVKEGNIFDLDSVTYVVVVKDGTLYLYLGGHILKGTK